MRLQVMVQEGPFHGTLFTLNSRGNDAPSELRLAWLNERISNDLKINASLYRLIGHERVDGIEQASYSFLRELESGLGLIDMYLVPEEGVV